jgi:hypothetical protein
MLLLLRLPPPPPPREPNDDALWRLALPRLESCRVWRPLP